MGKKSRYSAKGQPGSEKHREHGFGDLIAEDRKTVKQSHESFYKSGFRKSSCASSGYSVSYRVARTRNEHDYSYEESHVVKGAGVEEETESSCPLMSIPEIRTSNLIELLLDYKSALQISMKSVCDCFFI